MKIVLASGSPRRYELLRMIGLTDFEVIPDTEEEILCDAQNPEQAVCLTALKKAKNVSSKCASGAIIIAADTEVYLDGKPFGKPKDANDAKRMLSELSGKRHTVYTAIAIIHDEDVIIEAEATDVFFRQLSDYEINAYVLTGDPMDKAGAYGVQGRAAVFIERLEGDFFNVMGLPVCRLTVMLRNIGVNL